MLEALRRCRFPSSSQDDVLLSVAVALKIDGPGLELIEPLMTPVEEFSDKPLGSEFTDQVNEPVPPAAVSVDEYGAPSVPFGNTPGLVTRTFQQRC